MMDHPWPQLVGLAAVFVLLQLFAIGLANSSDSVRDILLVYGSNASFFGDINGVVGAIGFKPLDFVLPVLLYSLTYKPPRSSLTYWINLFIIVVSTGAGIMGSFSSIRS
ncbi:hypothetical protein DITRI_Ditri07aG0123800 [Diplodiscus trichospermus]